MNPFIGEIAAVFTALCWSFTSIFFTFACKAVGSNVVNRVRLLFATILLLVTHTIIYGAPIPIQADAYQWTWLGISAIIGLPIGDAMLFRAFVLVGTRISMLLLSLVPVMSTLLAWFFLNEKLGTFELLAIALTVGGIAWVVLERNNGNEHIDRRTFVIGILMGLGGALGQSIALITAKKGLYPEFPALSANLMRILVGTIVLWIIEIFSGKINESFRFWQNQKARWYLIAGAVVGPFLGIWLSLVAIKYAHVGIASTLMALPPLLLIPLTHFFFGDKITLRSVAGTVVATAGVAIIFLV
ncbi:DMT family transporter [candidate division KSB1 bacterium]|nr:DMT family transporter [candidate division KSB1 bacterium]